jgi:hypothetical protein
MAPDRQNYYVLTDHGIARFDVVRRALAEIIPIRIPCPQRMSVSPSGRHWYFYGGTPEYRVVDAISRQEIHHETGTIVTNVVFSDDGQRRYEVRWTGSGTSPIRSLRAVNEQSGSELWTVSFPSGEFVGSLAVGADGVYLAVLGPGRSGTWYDDVEVRRLDLENGSVLTTVSVNALWGSDVIVWDLEVVPGRVIISAYREATGQPRLLGALDSQTLALQTAVSESAAGTAGGELVIVDEAKAYLMYIGIGRPPAGSVRTVDLRTLQMSSPRSVNVSPDNLGFEETRAPDAPMVSIRDIAGDRVSITWDLATSGGAPGSVAVVLVRLGAPPPVEFPVAADVREWTSPPLQTGSYSVYLTVKRGNAGMLSNAALFSIGAVGVPQPPTGLSAAIRDASLRLTWTAATTGPPPTAYVIEAAISPSAAFTAVALTAAPEFDVPRVPTGEWSVRVRAITESGASTPTEAVSFSSAPCASAPEPPSTLSAMVTGGAVTLRWTPPASGPGVESYVVEGVVAPSELQWAQVLSIAASSALSLAAPPGTYGVRLRSRNACGLSSPSNELVVILQ